MYLRHKTECGRSEYITINEDGEIWGKFPEFSNYLDRNNELKKEFDAGLAAGLEAARIIKEERDYYKKALEQLLRDIGNRCLRTPGKST